MDVQSVDEPVDAAQSIAMSDRRMLRFPDAVLVHFAFLTNDGFRPVLCEPTLARFESKRQIVTVYHGRQSYEVGLEIGPSATARVNKTPYSMSEIIRLVEPDKAEEYRNYVAQDAEGVEEGVRRLASLLRRYAAAGLFDDPDLFVRLERQRSAWKLNLARDLNLTQLRQKLDAAWRSRDYARVIDLLEPMRSELTSTELKKLEFATQEMDPKRRRHL